MEQITTWFGSIIDWNNGNVAKENTLNHSENIVFKIGDILKVIFSNFGITDLKNFSRCTKAFKLIGERNELWVGIRSQLECPQSFTRDKEDKIISEKEQVKRFILDMRKRHVQCYYPIYPSDNLSESFKLLRQEEKAWGDESISDFPFHPDFLYTLPDQIVRFNCLKTLDLSKNEFATFPVIVMQLKNLKELDLSKNHISREKHD